MHGIYPKGSSAGLKRTNLERELVEDDEGKKYYAMRQEFNWDIGLSIRDYRYGGRLANINIRNGLAASATLAKEKKFVEELKRLVSRVKAEGVAQSLYMDKLTFEYAAMCFSRLTMENAVTYGNAQQKLDKSILGITVAMSDALNVREEAITAA